MRSEVALEADRLIGFKEVSKITGIKSRQTLLTKERRGEFPRRRYKSATCVGWLESDVLDWVENLPRTLDELAERRASAG